MPRWNFSNCHRTWFNVPTVSDTWASSTSEWDAPLHRRVGQDATVSSRTQPCTFTTTPTPSKLSAWPACMGSEYTVALPAPVVGSTRSNFSRPILPKEFTPSPPTRRWIKNGRLSSFIFYSFKYHTCAYSSIDNIFSRLNFFLMKIKYHYFLHRWLAALEYSIDRWIKIGWR